MSRAPAKFTQADIHRALKAAAQVGADMVVVLTKAGDILISKGPTVAVGGGPDVANRPRRVP